jgi:hypothetical protein
MASISKVVTMPHPAIQPEVKDWIDHVIVPALIKAYLAERAQENLLAPVASVSDNRALKLVSAKGSRR